MKVKIQFAVESDTRTRLEVIAATEGITMSKAVEKAIAIYFKSNRKNIAKFLGASEKLLDD